jgi:hypothetical protein
MFCFVTILLLNRNGDEIELGQRYMAMNERYKQLQQDIKKQEKFLRVSNFFALDLASFIIFKF